MMVAGSLSPVGHLLVLLDQFLQLVDIGTHQLGHLKEVSKNCVIKGQI
jgi:hypothetical protein